MTTYFIGIDGGGTKTDFLLTNGKDMQIGRHQEGASSYLSIGIDGLCHIIQSGVEKLLQLTNIELSQIHSMAIGVPSYGEIKSDQENIDQALFALFPNLDIYITNDVEVGFYAGLGEEIGINLVAGTGSIGYGVNQNGQSARVGGWGEIIGDDGAGFWVGQQLLNTFSQMADGRLAKTQMYQELKNRCYIERDLSLLDHVYVPQHLRRTQIASFSSICNEMAQKGDLTCQGILHEAAEELSLHIYALAKQLNFSTKEPISVSYSGSVFKSKIVLEKLQQLLGSNYQLQLPQSEPVFGAILLAKKHYL